MEQKASYLAGILAIALITGCASTEGDFAAPDSNTGQVITLQVGPYGRTIAVDQNGNEVAPEDDSGAFLLMALTEAMQEERSLTDEEIWFTDTDNNKTHIQSGGICPAIWGEFRRSTYRAFNRNGQDVGCGYGSETLQASFTFYFYRNSQSAEIDASEVLKLIENRVPAAKPVNIDPIAIISGPYAIKGVEGVGSNGIETRNSVAILKNDGWQIKLRMTYPSERAFQAESLAAIMLQAQADQISPDGFVPELENQPGSETGEDT